MRNLAIVFLLALCGCATGEKITFDARNPAFTVYNDGIMFGDRKVHAKEVPDILKDYSVPRNRTIHIRVHHSVRSLSEARFLMGCLAKAGYTRPILVTERKGQSVAVEGKAKNFETWSRDDTPDTVPQRRRVR